tara:strand:+ start:386 stop:2536 length:2151 start_codon:yes stop_codon:yes gene_type:complete
MAKISVDKILARAKSAEKKGNFDEARKHYQEILNSFPKNSRARRGLSALNQIKSNAEQQNPPQEVINLLVDLFKQGNLTTLVDQAKKIIAQYPYGYVTWSILAATHQRMGKIDEAVEAFEKVTFLNVNYPEGLNNLGVALKAQGNLEKAKIAFSQAITLRPKFADACNNLGNVYFAQKKFSEAANTYRNAISAKHNFSEAYSNLGTALVELEQISEAIEAFDKAIALNPDFAEAYNNLGDALRKQNNLEMAAHVFKKAISLKPEFAQAYNNLGNIFLDLGKLDEAAKALKMAISIAPSYSEAHNNIGNLFKEQQKLKEAITSYQKAISIDPNYADAYNNLGNAIRETGRSKDAIKLFEKCISLKRNHYNAYNNIGSALQDQGKLDEALTAYLKAISYKPDFADAHNNMAGVYLRKLDFKRGFELYEWRWKTKAAHGSEVKTSKPFWEGQKKKRIFLWAEQGIGDEIMFSSMIPELHAISSELVVQCDERLVPLFRRSFNKDIVYESKRQNVREEDYDFHISMGSLFQIFRPDENSFKRTSRGYLKCNQTIVNDIRNKLQKNNSKKLVGINWRSNSLSPGAFHRNLSLAQLATCINASNIQLVNLQYGEVSEEIRLLKESYGVNILQFPKVDNFYDIDGLGALITVCDQIASVDNATAHLAGALGAKTNLLLPFNSNWRWGTDQSTSYLYKSLKLYKQDFANDWDTALEALQGEILD